MTFKATIDERGQIVLPREALDALGLEESSVPEFEVEGTTLKLKPARDRLAFDAWAAKYGGSMREQFLAEGHTSVDGYMKEICPEW